jgi:xanthine dehydrogenase accessory factor
MVASAPLADRIRELVAGRVPFVHALVVRAQLPASVRAGADAIVLGDGSIEGFVGGQCTQASVRTAALEALRERRTVLLRVLPEDGRAFPDSPGAEVVVNPCLSGGALEIFLEPVLPPPIVQVVGGSPIALALAELAGPLDFVVRDQQAGPSGATAVVVASHGYGEEAAIRAALDAGVGWIGLVASRRRGTEVLSAMGLDEAERSRVHTPAGLDIGARTAPEIALSILAGIVSAIRGEGLGAPGSHVGTVGSDGGTVRASAPVPGPAGPGAAATLPGAGGADGPGSGGAGVQAPPRTVIDPVCGMTVTVMPDTPHQVIDGVDYWYCATGCLRRHAAQGAR